MQLYVDFETEPEGIWTLVDHTRKPVSSYELIFVHALVC